MQQLYGIVMGGVNSEIKHEIPESMSSRLRENVFVFSGAKTYTELRDLGSLLVGENGNIKPFHQFWQDTRQIHNTYNKTYLEAEYLFATQSAHAANQWAEIEADGDDYNLQYRTANDDRVREEHWILHDITLPPSDPFWKSYYPPNGWRCRCRAVQVRKSKYPVSDSEKASELGKQATTVIGKDGRNTAAMFRFNPGKEKVIFPESHPYFNELNKGSKKALERAYATQRVKELRAWAKENIAGETVSNKGLEKAINITNTGIKEFLNQPHMQYAEKNELVKDIKNIVANAKYLGKKKYHKENQKIVSSHIFEIKIKGKKSWLIAREDINGNINLYSISDSDKVLLGIKK